MLEKSTMSKMECYNLSCSHYSPYTLRCEKLFVSIDACGTWIEKQVCVRDPRLKDAISISNAPLRNSFAPFECPGEICAHCDVSTGICGKTVIKNEFIHSYTPANISNCSNTYWIHQCVRSTNGTDFYDKRRQNLVPTFASVRINLFAHCAE